MNTTGLDTFCFDARFNPDDPAMYELNVTDVTGELIPSLSHSYTTSRCLTLTSNLYPDVCGPFKVTVTATNQNGNNTINSTINSTGDNGA